MSERLHGPSFSILNVVNLPHTLGFGHPCHGWTGAFVEVSAEAGIDFHYTHGGTGQKYFIETMGPGCAFLDYDSDGLLDCTQSMVTT